MAYIGPSFARATKGDTFTFKFTMTVADVPTDLTTPTVKAYEEGSAVEFTGGITLTAPYDSKVGLNELVIDTSNAAYTAGKHYDFFFSAGSVGAVTLVGTGFFHLALIPEPANLQQVNGGSTGATAGILELSQLKLSTAGDYEPLFIKNTGANGYAGALIAGAPGNGQSGAPGIFIQGGRSSATGDAGAGVEIQGGFSGDAGKKSAPAIHLAAGTCGSGDEALAIAYMGQGPTDNYAGNSVSLSGLNITARGNGVASDAISLTPEDTGKAINALGQIYVAPTNPGDTALVLQGPDGNESTPAGGGLLIKQGANTGSGSGPGPVTVDGNGTANAVNVLGSVGIFAASGTDGDAISLVPDAAGKAINALGQVYIAPTNTDDDAIQLVPNGVGKAIMAALAELPQGVPSSTPSVDEALMLIYMALRNKLSVHKDTAFKEVYDDAGTRIAKKAITDDGVTYSENKMSSGA